MYLRGSSIGKGWETLFHGVLICANEKSQLNKCVEVFQNVCIKMALCLSTNMLDPIGQ
jgi:hypothetical protein